MNRNLQGLRKPSPDAIAKARDDTSAQVNRVSLTLVGTALFCQLSLLTPDSALLAGNEKLSVPPAVARRKGTSIRRVGKCRCADLTPGFPQFGEF
jgi:hypothetical protein